MTWVVCLWPDPFHQILAGLAFCCLFACFKAKTLSKARTRDKLSLMSYFTMWWVRKPHRLEAPRGQTLTVYPQRPLDGSGLAPEPGALLLTLAQPLTDCDLGKVPLLLWASGWFVHKM